MTYVSIFAFVLASCAVALGALALIISLRHTRTLARWRSQMQNDWQKHAASIQLLNRRVSDRLRELEGQTPAKLAAEVAALSDAVSRVADTHRRFAGKVWAELGLERRREVDGNGHSDATDDELQAMLALQKAGPPARQ